MAHESTVIAPAAAVAAEAGQDATNAGRQLPHWIYALLLLLIPAVFLWASIPIVRSAAFPAASGDPFLLNADYPYGLKHVDCAVVIYGDSSAITGIDPTIIERITGLKTCNIAQARSALEIVGMHALDLYLQNNAAPRYLLLQFTPETLARDKEFFWPEGLTLLVRHKSLPVALAMMVAHPVKSYEFSIWAIKMRLQAFLDGPADFSATEQTFKAKRGLLLLPKPAQTSCVNHRAIAPPVSSWTRQLRAEYSSGGTRVIIDVAPVADCTVNAVAIAPTLAGVTDNTLPVYPVSLFCDLDRHLTPLGSERLSSEIGAQIMANAGGR
jgi:hypothetical protein